MDLEKGVIECFILLNDYVITIYNLGVNKEKIVDKLKQLIVDFETRNMNFDNFPFIDYVEHT